MEEVSQGKTKRAFKLLTAGVFALEYIYGLSVTVWGVLIASLMTYYDKTYTDVGFATSFNGLGSILGVLLLMTFLDRFKKPKVLIAACLLFLLCVMGQGIAPPFAILPFVYFLKGVAALSLDTVNSSVIVDMYKDRSKVYVNILHGFYGAGSISGPIFATLIMTNGYQWNHTYILISAIIILVIVYYVTVMIKYKSEITKVSAPVKKEDSGEKLSVREFLKRKEVYLSIFTIFLCSGAWNMTTSWTQKFMIEVLGSTVYLGTIAVTLFYIGLTTSRFLVPILYKKMKPLSVLFLMLIVSIVSLIIAHFSGNIYMIPFGTFMAGAGMGLATPIVVSNICSLFPGQSGRASSFAMFGMGFSTFVFSYLGAYINTVFGIQAGVRSPIVFLSLALPCIYFLIRSNKKTDATANQCENIDTAVSQAD